MGWGRRSVGRALLGLMVLVATGAPLVVARPGAAASASLTTGMISTIAGGSGVDAAVEVGMDPFGLAGRGSTLYVTDVANGVVRAVDLARGAQRVVAGNGTYNPDTTGLGDGGPATRAPLSTPWGVAADAAGNVYVSERTTNRVRKIDPSGTISTVAGTGVAGFLGDGGPATEARVSGPTGLAVDAAGNLYIADFGNHRVRRVDSAGTITTVAGNAGDYLGNGGQISARLEPMALALDAAGNLLIGSDSNGHIYRLSGTTLTRAAQVPYYDYQVSGLAADSTGTIYASVRFLNRVFKIAPGGTPEPFAGTGSYDTPSSSGDGGPATAAPVWSPQGLVLDGTGNVYLAETGMDRVRRVDGSGTITTVAGNGEPHFSGENVTATTAQIGDPQDVEVDAAGNVVFIENHGRSVRSVSPSGVMRTLTRVDAGLEGGGLGVDRSGGVYLTAIASSRILKVDPTGAQTVVAGTGQIGFSGDGGPATAAALWSPYDVALDGAGNLYITDAGNNRIRKVDTSGRITTFAGTGHGAVTGDGGPAEQAELLEPSKLAVDRHGNVYFTDEHRQRIRVVDTTGRIFTVTSGFAVGDLAVDGAGNLYASDIRDHRVYRLDRYGTRTVVAGTGVRGLSGDGGPALAAQLNMPNGLAVSGGVVSIADYSNRRIRQMRLVPDGAVGWGYNGQGQTGTATSTSPTAPAAMSGSLLADGRTLSAGGLHSVAVNQDGTVSAWGWNGVGQLGLGSTTDASVPTRVPGLSGVRTVAAGWHHTLALKEDGTVWAWGWNAGGQLGTGDSADRHTPVQVPSLSNVIAVSAGLLHSVALRADGTVWAWGWNGVGQLGTGDTSDHRLPVVVPGLFGITAVSAGAHHSLAVRNDGTVWAWGWNGVGQVGTGSNADVHSPTPLFGLSRVVAVSAGAFHSLALTRDGNVWSWGWGAVGQLGTGFALDRWAPALTSPLGMRATGVSAGGAHSLVLLEDGTARAFGWNGAGQLGTGDTADRLSPVTVRALRGTRVVAAGVYHSVALAS